MNRKNGKRKKKIWDYHNDEEINENIDEEHKGKEKYTDESKRMKINNEDEEDNVSDKYHKEDNDVFMYLAMVGESASVVVTLGVVGLGDGVMALGVVAAVVSWVAAVVVKLGWRNCQGSGGLTTP